MKFTIKDFRKRYPNDDVCLQELMQKRFGLSSKCPAKYCKKPTKFHKIKGRQCYECQWCGHQIYPTAGTIFHKSTTPLTDWFYVMYLMTATRSGVSAKEIQRQLGVTYKCAWRMCHQIRKAMDENTVLKGTVEADETYVGGKGKNNKRGRGAENKTLVFGLVERKGAVMGRVVGNVKSSTVMPIVRSQVAIGTQVMTDEYPIYNKLKINGYKHKRVNHGHKQYVRGNVHTNTIEGFWSQLKRSISGTHVSVSPKHLQKYVDEFAFRYNQRDEIMPMFDRLLRNLVLLS